MTGVEHLNRTLEQELFALWRGASLGCLVCGEFVLRRGGAVSCPECGSRVGAGGVAASLYRERCVAPHTTNITAAMSVGMSAAINSFSGSIPLSPKAFPSSE